MLEGKAIKNLCKDRTSNGEMQIRSSPFEGLNHTAMLPIWNGITNFAALF